MEVLRQDQFILGLGRCRGRVHGVCPRAVGLDRQLLCGRRFEAGQSRLDCAELLQLRQSRGGFLPGEGLPLLVLVDFDLESLQVGEGLPGGVGDHAELDGLPVVRDSLAELRQIADGPQATLPRPQHQAVVGLFQDDCVQQADGSDGLLEILVTLLREGFAVT